MRHDDGSTAVAIFGALLCVAIIAVLIWLPSKNCPKLYALMQRLREAVRGVARVDP